MLNGCFCLTFLSIPCFVLGMCSAAMQSINNESVDTQEVFGPSSFQQLLTVLTTKLTVLADCLAAMLHDAHYAAQRPTLVACQRKDIWQAAPLSVTNNLVYTNMGV